MADAVRAVRGQRRAGIGIDDDGGKLRAIALALFLVVARDGSPMRLIAAFGRAAGEDDCCGGGSQSESTHAQNVRGRQGCTKHKLPRPIFCLVHRFVRLNYAQRPARLSCPDCPIRAGISTGTAIRIAVLANQLRTKDYFTTCREGEQQWKKVRGPEFPKG